MGVVDVAIRRFDNLAVTGPLQRRDRIVLGGDEVGLRVKLVRPVDGP